MQAVYNKLIILLVLTNTEMSGLEWVIAAYYLMFSFKEGTVC